MDRPDAFTFAIDADRSPGILLRLLNAFAQQNRVIDRVRSTAIESGLRIRLTVGAIDPDRARLIAAKMRATVGVRRVVLRGARVAQTPRRRA